MFSPFFGYTVLIVEKRIDPLKFFLFMKSIPLKSFSQMLYSSCWQLGSYSYLIHKVPMFFKLAISVFALTSFIALLPVVSDARKDAQVKGHIRKVKTPVHAHKRKTPNKTKLDNYGTKGNLNPDTGKVGKDDLFSGKGER